MGSAAEARLLESRDPKSIRYAPSEWEAIAEQARAIGVEPSRLARRLSLIGLKIVQALADGEDSSGMTPLGFRNTDGGFALAGADGKKS